MSNDKAAAFYVTLHGEVQGIGLRKRIREAARERGIKGWVRNRKAGHVQLHVEGPEPQARQLIADLQTGAIAADIDDIVVTRTEPADFEAFTILAPADAARIAPSLSRAALGRAKRLEEEYKDLNTTALALVKDVGNDQPELFALMRHIPSRFIGEPFIKRIKRSALGNITCSFAAESWAHRAFQEALKQYIGYAPSPVLEDKAQGQAFARRIGLRVPQTHQHDVPLSDIEFRPGVVIKPISGAASRGVFIINCQEEIFSVEHGRWLPDHDALRQATRLASERSRRGDRWSTEQFIEGNDGTPQDIKAYCFYGKAPLILETDRNGEKVKYCWWLRNQTATRTGKYEKNLFSGTGLSPEYIELAEEVSLKIPSPFARIDFLKSKDGPVFGEFTPQPGNFHGFDAATDTWLGREFAEARGRLVADLMKGKRFTEFDAFVADLRGSSAA